MKMFIRIMILSKLTLRMKLDNGCDSALKNTMLPQISYHLMRHLVQLQAKINGSNMVRIFGVFLFSCYSISSQNIEFCSYAQTQPQRNTYEMVIL